MKALSHLRNINFWMNGEIKEAWDLYQAKKKEQETGQSFNASGCYIPNAYESIVSSLRQIQDECVSLCEREFEVSKILMEKINNQDY